MSNMPFAPPGLQWRGRDCITTRKLIVERDSIVDDARSKSSTSYGGQ